MKDTLRKLKKHWITIWLVAVSVILCTFVTFAIYTEVYSVKRVVTTRSAPKVLFSSNCMYTTTYERRMPAAEFNVHVCNYDQNSPDIPNSTEIKYTLTAQLRVKYNGTIMSFSDLKTVLGEDTESYDKYATKAAEYSIGMVQDNNAEGIIESPTMLTFSDYSSTDYTITFGSESSYETLTAGVISADKFKVMIPSTDFDTTEPEFYVYVEADPKDDNSLAKISTLLYGSKNIIITSSWSGTLAERNTNTTDYDFYNYIITGSGSGKLDIMWDPDWFEVDDFFFTKAGVTFDGNATPTEISGGEYDGWKKVTIVVDSTDSGKARYELQLYKTKADTPYTGANDASKHISCKMQ